VASDDLTCKVSYVCYVRGTSLLYPRVSFVCTVVACSDGLVPLCDSVCPLVCCLSFFVCRGFSVYGIVFRFLGLCVFYVFVWWIIIEKHTQIIKRQLCVCVCACGCLAKKG
jgi:hypothetical protein